MKRKLRKTFSSLLVSYLITMIVTVSICGFTYYETLRVVEKDVLDSNLTMLKQSSEMIDANLDDVTNIVSQVSMDPKLVQFMSVNPIGLNTNYYTTLDVWRDIQVYQFSNSFIYNFYLVFPDSDLLISPNGLSNRLPMYYDGFLRYSGMNYEEWSTEFTEKFHSTEYIPAHDITIEGKTSSYITYLQSIPIGFRNNFKGTMVVLIPKSELQSLMNRQDINVGGWATISDHTGKVIASFSDRDEDIDLTGIDLQGNEGHFEQRLENKDMLITYYTSPENQWTYVTAMPTRVVMAKVDNIKRTNTWIIVVGLLFGLVAAIFFAFRHSKPIKALIQIFSEKSTVEVESNFNDYHFLEHSISSLITNNAALRLESEKQQPLLRAAVLDSLFRGEFGDHEELNTALDDVGLTITGKWYGVVNLELKWPEESNPSVNIDTENAIRIVIKDVLHRELGDYGNIHDLRQEKIAVMLNYSFDEAVQCHDYTTNLLNRLSERFNNYSDLQVVFGVGNLYDNLLNVYRSYKEAMIALELVDHNKGEYMLHYDRLPKDSQGYYYPMEIEQRLIHLTKSGNTGESMNLLQDIYEENINNRIVPVDMIALFLHDISATVYKLMNEISQMNNSETMPDYRAIMNNIHTNSTFKESFEYIKEAFMGLCSIVHNQKKSHNVILRDRVIAYINENYMDGGLGLTSVATEMGINEVYLSQFFKSQTGENFSNYLENLRMSYARGLLMKGQITIDEVARQVGYLSTNTFYKAFKRMEGVSPGAFRNKIGGIQ